LGITLGVEGRKGERGGKGGTWLTFLLVCPWSGIARPYSSSIFRFWGASTLFTIVAVVIYIPPAVYDVCCLCSCFLCSNWSEVES
jgi:hypothetical protein